MEQRARVMGKTGPADVYRAYINKMKEKTKLRRKKDGLMDEEQNEGKNIMGWCSMCCTWIDDSIYGTTC